MVECLLMGAKKLILELSNFISNSVMEAACSFIGIRFIFQIGFVYLPASNLRLNSPCDQQLLGCTLLLSCVKTVLNFTCNWYLQ